MAFALACEHSDMLTDPHRLSTGTGQEPLQPEVDGFDKRTKPSFTVMHIISDLGIGGAQEVVRTLAAYLPEHGCRPVVCTFRDGPLRHEIEQMGIPVELLPDRRHTVLSLPQFLGDLWRIRRALHELVERYQVDVIQTHLLRRLDFLVLTLRRAPGLPLVFWTVHNTNFTLRAEHLQSHKWLLRPKRVAYRLLYRLGNRWANGFIAVSEEVRGAVLRDIGNVDENITVIPNGVDVRRYQSRIERRRVRSELNLDDDHHLMSVVGTLKEQKGHRYLIEAVSLLVSEHPQLRIAIVGDGELRHQLEAAVNTAELTDHVIFLGNRNDVPELLSASDSFVLPSLWEGLPMALIEAMAAGLPIIATEVSGTKQVMVADRTGLLVPPGDATALADAIRSLLSDPVQAETMGAAARARVVESFSAARQAQLHRNLYEREWRRLQSRRETAC